MLKELLIKFEFSLKVFREFEELKRKAKCISDFESLGSVDFIVNRRFAYIIGEFLEACSSHLDYQFILEILYNGSELVYFGYQKSFGMSNFKYDIKMEEDKNIYSFYCFGLKVGVILKIVLILNYYVYCFII